jgi:hypothetical protein
MSFRVPRRASMIWLTSSIASCTAIGSAGRRSRGGGGGVSRVSRTGGRAVSRSSCAGGKALPGSPSKGSASEAIGSPASSGGAGGPWSEGRGARGLPPLRPRPPRRPRRAGRDVPDRSGDAPSKPGFGSGSMFSSNCPEPPQMQWELCGHRRKNPAC